jgi:hypothetical protein
MTRRLLLHVPALALLAACGGGGAPGSGGATVRGAFRAGEIPADGDTLYVRVAGDSERVPVAGGAFVLPGVGPGPATLRFARGDDSVARMEVGELPEGASLELRGIRLDGEGGLAFPAAVGLDGAATVTVNGLRYAARPLPAQVRADGTVLAVSDAGDALLVRPADASLPDLRVVVGPLTETTTPDGDPVPAGELERGDSVRVEGSTDGPYVVAGRIVAPRSLALREAGGDAGGAGGGGARSGAAPPAAAAAASGRGGGESGEESTGRDDSRGRDDAKGRDDGHAKERKDDKPGRGRGRGRGRD